MDLRENRIKKIQSFEIIDKLQTAESLNAKMNEKELARLHNVINAIKSSIVLSNLNMGGTRIQDLVIFTLVAERCIYIRNPVTNKHATVTTVQDGMNFLMTHT